MNDEATGTERGIFERAGLAVAHRVLVLALPALVLVQAALAGQHLAYFSGITLHGILGNISFAVAALLVGVTVARRRPGIEFAVAVALAALAFAQVGLGYVGRETSAALAWHIPVGVAIFGLACYELALVTRD